jgi:hypothetical protein
MTSSRVALGAAAGALLLLGPTCTAYDDGIAVEVEILHHYGQRQDEIPAVNVDGAPRRFVTDLGYEVELERAYLTIQRVQLVECAPAAGGEAGAAHRRAPWAGGVAHAHDLSGDPTVLGTPYVDSALRADFALARVGVMEPPPGRYCRARVALGPADGDALGLPADIDMVGLSFYLEGSYLPPGGTRPIHFIIESSEEREALVDLVDVYRGQPTPIVLDGDHRDIRLSLAMLTNFWLDGVDFRGEGLPQEERGALDAIAVTIHHHPGL